MNQNNIYIYTYIYIYNISYYDIFFYSVRLDPKNFPRVLREEYRGRRSGDPDKTGHGTTTSPMVLMNPRSGRVVDVLTRCGL